MFFFSPLLFLSASLAFAAAALSAVKDDVRAVPIVLVLLPTRLPRRLADLPTDECENRWRAIVDCIGSSATSCLKKGFVTGGMFSGWACVCVKLVPEIVL